MPNHLAGSPSPYLRQHADNPVDWYPWGEEALARARREDRPILLSIGYSACHWCHVMAHECFEDEETAAVMNAHFINIKVDREERPDLDQIYQSAHQLLARRPGGWPLTVFLTPDQSPFYAGTYFPKTPRYGLPGFADLLGQVVAAYRERRGEILQQNTVMREVLARLGQGQGKGALPDTPQAVEVAMDFFRNHFDRENGGLGSAPKFPQASDQRFLLRRAWQGDSQAAEMARTTLTHMALGGIYDQLGGGFFRYSVDAQWQIPHFEKMLYDNGQLLALYADAWALFREPVYARILRETVAWLEREMAAPDGGFYSALDADSAGGEGAFYVWDREEWQRLLTADEYAVAALHYGLLQPPNFEGVHWHPHVAHPLTEVAGRLRMDGGHAQDLQEAARRKLYAARARRQRPAVDDKILCAWNALAAQGFARAGRAFGEGSWIDAAHRTVDFLRERFWQDGRLHAAYHGGRAYLDAYLDDHAFLLDALLEVLQARFRPEDLDFTRDLADALLARFMDQEGGGFWFTAADHEPLVARMKSAEDNALPSGNGVAVFALQRLGHLLGEKRYLQAAESALKAFATTLREHPASSATLSAALEEFDHPPQVLILRGTVDGLAGLQGAIAEHRMRPDLLTVAIPEGVAGLPEALDKPVKGMACAWLCRGNACLPPIHTAEALRAALGPAKDGSGTP